MLYYICPMHTLFTVFVIVVLYVFKDANGSLLVIGGKLAALTLAIQQLYASPTVFKLVFGTLPVVDPLFSFTDPLHPEFTDKLHEWHFRSGLDRYVWIFGMACALVHAPCARALARLDEMPCVRVKAWLAAASRSRSARRSRGTRPSSRRTSTRAQRAPPVHVDGAGRRVPRPAQRRALAALALHAPVRVPRQVHARDVHPAVPRVDAHDRRERLAPAPARWCPTTSSSTSPSVGRVHPPLGALSESDDAARLIVKDDARSCRVRARELLPSRRLLYRRAARRRSRRSRRGAAQSAGVVAVGVFCGSLLTPSC